MSARRDPAGWMEEERAVARANDSLARPLPVVPCVVGDRDGNVYPDESWDLVLVRPHHADARVMLAHCRRRDLVADQIVQAQFGADRGLGLLRVLGRAPVVPTPAGLAVYMQWFTDEFGQERQTAYFTVDPLTGALTSIGLPVAGWVDCGSGLFRDGTLWVVSSTGAGHGALVASYTAADGWTVTNLGVNHQGVGGMTRSVVDNTLYFATASNIYGNPIEARLWAIDADGVVNQVGIQSFSEVGSRLNGVGKYSADLVEYPDRIVIFHSYPDDSDPVTHFTSWDLLNESVERGPIYEIDGHDHFPSGIAFRSDAKGAVTNQFAEWRGNSDMLDDLSIPVAAGWNTAVDAPEGGWGRPHAYAYPIDGAGQGVATLKSDFVPAMGDPTDIHDAIAFFGAGVAAEFGSRVDTILTVGTAGQTAAVSVVGDPDEDNKPATGFPVASRLHAGTGTPLLYICLGSPPGIPYRNEAVDAGILVFTGTAVSRLTTGTPEGQGGSPLFLYSEYEAIPARPKPMEVLYAIDSTRGVVMVQEDGTWESLGTPFGTILTFSGNSQVAAPGALFVAGNNTDPRLARYTRANDWEEITGFPLPTTSSNGLRLVQINGLSYFLTVSVAEDQVEMWEVPTDPAVTTAANASILSFPTVRIDSAVSASPDAKFAFVVLQDFTTNLYSLWRTDGVTWTALGNPSLDSPPRVHASDGLCYLSGAVSPSQLYWRIDDDGDSFTVIYTDYTPTVITGGAGYGSTAFQSFGTKPISPYHHYGSTSSTATAYFERVGTLLISAATDEFVIARAMVVINGRLYFTLGNAPSDGVTGVPNGIHRWAAGGSPNGSSDDFVQLYASLATGGPTALWGGLPV